MKTWRKLFLFSRSDRLAVALLAAFVALGLIIARCEKEKDVTATRPLSKEEISEAEQFFHSLAEKYPRKTAQGKGYDRKLSPSRFNPNTADSLTLIRFGLTEREVRGFLRYRRAGGTFRKEKDLLRLYSLPESIALQLLPYVFLPEKKPKWSARNASSQPHVSYLYPEKLHEGECVELSIADTTALKRIPGIGSYYARKIVRYGEMLGGWAEEKQVLEVEGVPQETLKWITLTQVSTKKIALNKATYEELYHHPYLSKKQARAILRKIRMDGKIYSWKQLQNDTLFNEKDFQRLAPYFILAQP